MTLLLPGARAAACPGREMDAKAGQHRLGPKPPDHDSLCVLWGRTSRAAQGAGPATGCSVRELQPRALGCCFGRCSCPIRTAVPSELGQTLPRELGCFSHVGDMQKHGPWWWETGPHHGQTSTYVLFWSC